MPCANCGQSHAIGMACGKSPKAMGIMSDASVNTARIPKGTDTPKGLKVARKPPKIK